MCVGCVAMCVGVGCDRVEAALLMHLLWAMWVGVWIVG